MTNAEIKTQINQITNDFPGIYTENIINLFEEGRIDCCLQAIDEAKAEYERLSKLNIKKIANKRIKTLKTFTKVRSDLGKAFGIITRQNQFPVFQNKIAEITLMLRNASDSAADYQHEKSVRQLHEAASEIASLQSAIKNMAEANKTPEPSNDGPTAKEQFSSKTGAEKVLERINAFDNMELCNEDARLLKKAKYWYSEALENSAVMESKAANSCLECSEDYLNQLRFHQWYDKQPTNGNTDVSSDDFHTISFLAQSSSVKGYSRSKLSRFFFYIYDNYTESYINETDFSMLNHVASKKLPKSYMKTICFIKGLSNKNWLIVAAERLPIYPDKNDGPLYMNNIKCLRLQVMTNGKTRTKELDLSEINIWLERKL